MEKKMKLEIWLANANRGGCPMEVELIFTGKRRAEITKKIQVVEDEILYYMTTGDTKKEPCFIFGDFIIRKAGIQAIRLSEADY